MSERLPTPTQRAAAVRPESLGRSSATAERVAARDAVAADRADVLARLDAVTAAAITSGSLAFVLARLDALRAELRPQSAASRGGLAT